MLSLRFCVLLLIFSYAYAVCTSCHGEAPGCSGTRNNCPWITGVTSNAPALAAGTALSLTALIPLKFLRLFPRTVLDAVTALALRALSHGGFDPSGKTNSEVIQAVRTNQLSKDEGIQWASEKGASLEEGAAESEYKKISFLIESNQGNSNKAVQHLFLNRRCDALCFDASFSRRLFR